MIFNKLPRQVQKFVHLAVLAASVSLFAIAADVMAGNGATHVIDEIILPN